MAKGSDSFRVDIVLRCVGTNPADSALCIIELGGPAGWRVVEETIISGDADKTVARKKLRDALHGAFIERGPTAAVQENDGGLRSGSVFGRTIDIEMEIDALDGGVGDVSIDGDGFERLLRLNKLERE